MRGLTTLWVEFCFLCLEVQFAILAVASVGELEHRLFEVLVRKVIALLLKK